MSKNQTTPHYVSRNVNGVQGFQPGEDYETKAWGNGVIGNGSTAIQWTKTKNLKDVLDHFNNMYAGEYLSSRINPNENNAYLNILSGLQNLKDVNALQEFLGKQGYSGISVDGIAGAQTMNVLGDYISRELQGRQETPSKENDVYADYKGIGLAPYKQGPISVLPKITLPETISVPKHEWTRKEVRNLNPSYDPNRGYRLDADIMTNVRNSIQTSTGSPVPAESNVNNINKLFEAVGIRGSRGGWDRARERALANGDYTISNGFLKFNKNRLNNTSLDTRGYDISNLIRGYDWTKNPTNIQAKTNNGAMIAKNGGTMQKYQQGGAAPQGDPQQQIIQLVQAAMGGDEQATAQIQQIMQAAQQGDQQAAQLAEMIMQVMNQMQGGAPEQGGSAPVAARNGAKLNYIKKLKGECPEGYEMKYFKAGGKVCKKCQKKVEKACGGTKAAKCGTKFHRAGGVMEGILNEMFAKGGAMNRNKHTAFGEEKGANVVSTNHAGRWGGRKAFNERGTHNLNPHDKPNKFTAFGDEGKKKPTNVGLVGHKATGKTGRMQNKQKAGVTYKATAFGGEKQKRFHRGAKASSIGRIGSISGYPKGQGGKSGIGRMSIGGLLPKKNN